jgi:hypothetical protein
MCGDTPLQKKFFKTILLGTVQPDLDNKSFLQYNQTWSFIVLDSGSQREKARIVGCESATTIMIPFPYQ